MKARRSDFHWTCLALSLPFAVNAESEWIDRSPHKSGFLTANGVKLHYLDWGGMGPSMLFLHGLGDTAHIFDDREEALRARAEAEQASESVIAFDTSG